MLLKLLKFVIVSRFSKQILIVMLILLVYALFISSVSSSTATVYYYYGPAVLAFFPIIPVMGGGIAVLKSDRDFLFTLPVKRSDLAFSLFVVQLLSFGLIIIYVLAYSFSSLKDILAYALIDFIALILSTTSLGPITYSLKFGWRILIAVFLIVWAVSVFLGFPFSPAAIYTGHPIYADITSVLLAVVTVPLAFRSLSRVDLDLMKTFTRYSSGEVKHVKRFSGLSPTRAIFAENFFIMEVSGRINAMGGGGSYRASRFRLSRGIIVTSVLAAVYYYIFVFRLSSNYAEFATLILSIYSVIFIMFFTMGILGSERLWLGFMTRSPTHYLRDVIAAKSLSIAALLSPLAISNFAIAFHGNEQALNFGLTLLVLIPSLLIIIVYMSAFLYPLQIKEDLMMPGQFNLRQMATLLPALPTWILIGLSFAATANGQYLLALIITILTSVVIGGIAVALVSSKRLGTSVIERLVTAGFV